MILRFFSSMRLSLALFLLIALVSVAGTLAPIADGRYEVFYQSLWYRLILCLLALNLAVCTLKSVRRNLREPVISGELSGAGRSASLPDACPEDEVAKVLREKGYRLRTCKDGLVAKKGRAGRWGAPVVHLSCLLIMIGALAGQLGFVGTLNIHVGNKSAVYFDWSQKEDLPLGFEFRLDHFEPIFYPIELRFAAIDAETGRTLESYTAREGESVLLPLPELEARLIRFFPEEERLELGIYRRGVFLGKYQALSGKAKGKVENVPGTELVLRPTAFRDPLLKQLHSEVSILEEGRVVKSGLIEVNHPLVHRGVAIYQTAYNRDEYGRWYAGFQFSKDPGEPVVWFGSVLLVLGLLAAFFVPYRALGLVREEGRLTLVALAGFSGEEFERLASQLQKQDPGSPGSRSGA